MKNVYKITLLLFSLMATTTYGQLVGTNAYMIGDYVEIGIDAEGYEGAPTPASIPGTHERGGVGLGFVANPAMNAWAQYDGDFFLPGAPENGFGVQVNGVNYGNNRDGLYQITGSISSYEATGNCVKVYWSGAVAGVDVDVTYSMITTNLYYNTQVILTNTTASTLTDVYYYRSFDPDNNQSIGGTYTTTNTIEAQSTPSCEKALVSAEQSAPHPSYVGLGAIGPDYRVTYGGFANRNASNIWNGTGLVSAVGSTNTADEAISLAHRTYSLAPGESDTIQFTIILNSSDIDAAISSLYSFSYSAGTGVVDECFPVVDTATICSGQSETISVSGPGVNNFTWVWSPSTGLNTTTGAIVEASPSTTTSYTVTGTPVASCVSTTITKDIVVEVTPGPDLSITDPGPQCGTFDLTSLAYTDLNSTPGAVTEFYSVIPDSASQTANVWPGTSMVSGDVVYMLLADSTLSCFDVEPVVINFVSGNAGTPSDTTICNATGTTLDLNSMLSPSADVGGTWSENASSPSSGGFTPGSSILNASGVASGTYVFDYVVPVAAPCIGDTAEYTVIINDGGSAGADSSVVLCATSGVTLDLNTLLSGADAGGTWSETSGTPTGNFTSGTGMLDVGATSAGTYTFEYNVTPTALCPGDVAEFTITIGENAVAGPDNSTILCNTSGTSLDLNTLLSGADTGGTWSETSTTPTGSFTPSTGILNASGVATGAYTFEYEVTATSPCLNDIAEMTVTISNNADAGADNSSALCNTSGTTLDLNTLLSGADAGGAWSETSTTPTGGFTTSTGVLDVSGVTAGTYTFEYGLIAPSPCVSDVAEFTITVNQEVTAGADSSIAICNTSGTTLDLNTLLSGADAGGTWSETSTSPTGHFTTGTGVLDVSATTAGTYTFEYAVNAIAPCLNDLANITITIEQVVNAGADSSIVLCNSTGVTLDLNTLLSGADTGGAWSETSATPTGNFTTGTGVIDVSATNAGTYTFEYAVSAVAPCVNDASSFTVEVNPTPTISSIPDLEVCNGLDLAVPAFTSNLTGTIYNWNVITGTDIGFGLSGTGNIGTFNATNTGTNSLISTIEVTPVSPLGCIGDPISFNVTVHPTPTVNFVADTLIGCEGLLVNFNNLNPSVGDQCFWSFGDGNTTTVCDSVSNVYENSGVYDVSLTITSAEGCINSTTYSDYISVAPYPEAIFSFSPSQISIHDTEVVFNNTSTNADSYEWDFGDGTPLLGEEDPTHFYPEVVGADYTITLTALSNAGCSSVVQYSISVNEEIIFYVPNTFTPNGDNANDSFIPIITAGIDVYSYHLIIFNRWGEVVFESYDLTKGWDGTYGKNGTVQDGVYTCKITFGDAFSGKKYKHQGHVTVIR